jgi:group I intron endonuclease
VVIYKAACKKSGKAYIGQTVNPLEKRRRDHCSAALRGKSGCRAFANALRKYSHKAFIWEVIDFADTIEDLNVLEGLWIEAENTLAPNGYNLRTGGENSIPSAETRKKMSERNLSAETRKKMSEIQKGKKASIETKLKMSETRKGKKQTERCKRILAKYNMGNQHGKGYRHSAEAKRKISESRMGKKHPRAKAIIIDGIAFGAINEAVRLLGVDKYTLSRRLKSSLKRFANYTYA